MFYVETSLPAKNRNQITNIHGKEIHALNCSSYFLHSNVKSLTPV